MPDFSYILYCSNISKKSNITIEIKQAMKLLALAGNLVRFKSKCTIIVHDLRNKKIVDSSFPEIKENIIPPKKMYLKPFEVV